jgi:predicted transcriptional regulator
VKTEIDPGKRLAVEIAGRRRPSSPLAEHVRREAIAYTRRRLTEGASQATVARDDEGIAAARAGDHVDAEAFVQELLTRK